mmetsp:Transcript_2938/g.4028  ORF Transcript_2938/g.4028 Transcript_2938/m.4028 type:complete len:117 (+) Transcript_2938:52-402(+)|eukprot:CAMPEP_0185252274 /NCGR_PEP_ID=MMETSP1359-20130426/1414_1 /TAXON_ID=552665 /ORGANISM="Bigelowiella longifila, Strain CCMP242" /LENGTH=116 /DNA_ID=CAMNT_0027834401 /DNA_START=255 /DNA_END=605 /DNA_ORIENTATION=+
MSWNQYCAFPSASVAVISGIDGKQAWGVKGDWKASGEELAKMAKSQAGTMCSHAGEKLMIVQPDVEGCLFGASAKNGLVIKKLKKVMLAGICAKENKDKLIEEVNKFAESLKAGGY